jgi:hypothetical protein
VEVGGLHRAGRWTSRCFGWALCATIRGCAATNALGERGLSSQCALQARCAFCARRNARARLLGRGTGLCPRTLRVGVWLTNGRSKQIGLVWTMLVERVGAIFPVEGETCQGVGRPLSSNGRRFELASRRLSRYCVGGLVGQAGLRRVGEGAKRRCRSPLEKESRPCRGAVESRAIGRFGENVSKDARWLV